FSSSSSSSSSSAPTNSGSTLKSTSSSVSSSSSSGGKTVTIVVSSSSKNSYRSETGKSLTEILSPISNSSIFTLISSGISRGIARTCSSYDGCCTIPPSFEPTASPIKFTVTSTSNVKIALRPSSRTVLSNSIPSTEIVIGSVL